MVFQFNWIWTSNKGGANAAASPFILPAGETQTSVNQKHGKQHVKDFLEEHCDQLGSSQVVLAGSAKPETSVSRNSCGDGGYQLSLLTLSELTWTSDICQQ